MQADPHRRCGRVELTWRGVAGNITDLSEIGSHWPGSSRKTLNARGNPCVCGRSTRLHFWSRSAKYRPKTKADVKATIDEVSAGFRLDDGVCGRSVLFGPGAPSGVRYTHSRMPAATITKAAPKRNAALRFPKAVLSVSNPQNKRNPAPMNPIKYATRTSWHRNSSARAERPAPCAAAFNNCDIPPITAATKPRPKGLRRRQDPGKRKGGLRPSFPVPLRPTGPCARHSPSLR